MKKRSILLCATAAVIFATAVAGCGKTTYFAGRTLPPSGILNRVLIAIQNPSPTIKGALQFVDAYYDIRSGYKGTPAAFSISGYGAALPYTIQNMPEETEAYVYGYGDGSFVPINYEKESASSGVGGLSSLSASIFITRNHAYVFAADQGSHMFHGNRQHPQHRIWAESSRGLPGEREPGGSVAFAFVQNSNYVYYPRKLTLAQTTAYLRRAEHLAQGRCGLRATEHAQLVPFSGAEPRSRGCDRHLLWSAAALRPAHQGSFLGRRRHCIYFELRARVRRQQGFHHGASDWSDDLSDRAAVGSFAHNFCAGGCDSSASGRSQQCACRYTTTMYVVGQQPQQVQGQTLFAGDLTVVNLANNTASAPIAISDGAPGAVSRMVEGDDNTLWIGMTKCTNGVRAATGLPYGCLTMFNTTNNTVTTILPYIGDATGIAAVTGLHKIYSAQGGQVYINSTVDGSTIDNQFVTVTGTAYDVAYMDATSDADNTVY